MVAARYRSTYRGLPQQQGLLKVVMDRSAQAFQPRNNDAFVLAYDAVGDGRWRGVRRKVVLGSMFVARQC